MFDVSPRNPFKYQGRVNLPPFSECLQSLGSPESFRGFGESLSAASPVSRLRADTSKEINSSKGECVDYSYLTMEISEMTSPGTPPPQVERYYQCCATTISESSRRGEGEEEDDTSGEITVTPTHLPPLFPNVSPIERSRSANAGVSVPRTEPQEVHEVRVVGGKACSVDLKVADTPGAAASVEWCDHPFSCSSSPCLDYIPSYEDLLLEDCGAFGTWYQIQQRADNIIPPLSESIDVSWFAELSNRYGDFAYHRPHLTRATTYRRYGKY
ncbi:hypothetical protein, conserved [Trypanosoma brucei gambiense DAL972]|uniref:Uncharacterized protein n=2 Tax=Trypanosoma brucei TaxID=5691 RepID=Q385G6_TRYB2|nr:hypothetical protein, conserved [Trypanosoma brucei gambiense DAL972]XP_828677.1 hypothetical protein, conserved [Trypanosoma brucei brucei TREU927]EAN79565.1 hypothetical protein, conserved [Trypanosoma brucei brucei TREU927]CBH17559.1 hypothetical protein, conserved [Trypanosoma brucei gambiense DAL972]|eukprot:XP_011779823.1 hypothetical protein, conserved [Trypanosoma brucei gambiense DAL972]